MSQQKNSLYFLCKMMLWGYDDDTITRWGYDNIVMKIQCWRYQDKKVRRVLKQLYRQFALSHLWHSMIISLSLFHFMIFLLSLSHSMIISLSFSHSRWSKGQWSNLTGSLHFHTSDTCHFSTFLQPSGHRLSSLYPNTRIWRKMFQKTKKWVTGHPHTQN